MLTNLANYVYIFIIKSIQMEKVYTCDEHAFQSQHLKKENKMN